MPGRASHYREFQPAQTGRLISFSLLQRAATVRERISVALRLSAPLPVVSKFCFVLKGHVCQPRVEAQRKPWEETRFIFFSPAGAGHPLEALEDLPFQGSRLGASFSQGFRFAPTLG